MPSDLFIPSRTHQHPREKEHNSQGEKKGLTQRTGRRITTLEPLEQARPMEFIPARSARLVGEPAIGGDGHDGIADGAFSHALKVQGQILAEEGEAVDDGGGLEVDDGL